MTVSSFDDSSTASQVRAQALAVAQGLEEQQGDGDFVARLVADTLEVVADTRGEVTLVLTVGGPHIELRLGCGQPTVFASWGGEQATCPVFLDPDVLEDEVGVWWHAAMAQSMSNPPYEG
jgi:hypothetical protein